MLATMWTVEGEEFAVDQFAATYQIDQDTIWRKGEPRRPGYVPTTSGFRLAVTEAEAWDAAIAELQVFLRDKQPAIAALGRLSVRQELDIGFTVGGEPHTDSVSLPPALLAQIAAAGITLVVSAYPLHTLIE